MTGRHCRCSWLVWCVSGLSVWTEGALAATVAAAGFHAAGAVGERGVPHLFELLTGVAVAEPEGSAGFSFSAVLLHLQLAIPLAEK
jgi:hypothetical protein